MVPRWTPEGVRNGLFIQRIKDKLGNRSNASTEMELQDTWGLMVGEEGSSGYSHYNTTIRPMGHHVLVM